MKSLLLTEGKMALATDLYELTMAAAYFENNERHRAVFELFVRTYPRGSCYLLTAGLEQVVQYVLNMRFDDESIHFLRNHQAFGGVTDGFFEYLRKFRFTGDVFAVPEGTVVFANEPIIRVVAPILEAQLLETYLLSLVNFQTLIATKASKIVRAAKGKGVVEFGSRRAHGPQAALLAARAAYIGGCIGTSNVLAGHELDIPIYGTIAHSFIMNYDTEREAFEKFCKVFRTEPAMLVDTYDVVQGTKTAVEVGKRPSFVRIDSGDRYRLSRRVRKILDEAGLQRTKIFVSGDLNERKIAQLTLHGAPIDAFGVGTELVTARDDPALQGIYKLVAIERNDIWVPRVKTSPGKQTLPGPRQIFRKFTTNGKISGDIMGLADEKPPQETVPLMQRIVESGNPVCQFPSLGETRRYALSQIDALPTSARKLQGCVAPKVRLTQKLSSLAASLYARHHAS